MQLVWLFDLVDNIDELGTTHQPDEDHHEKEHVDVLTEEDSGIEHVESEKDQLCNSDHPNPLDLDKGQWWAGNEHAELIAQIENDKSVLIDKFSLTVRVQVYDLLSVRDCERRRNRVFQEIYEWKVGHQQTNFPEHSADILAWETHVVLDTFFFEICSCSLCGHLGYGGPIL